MVFIYFFYYINFILFIFLFFVIYFFFFTRIFYEVYFCFIEIFPHVIISSEEFFIKYECNLENLSFIQELQVYGSEFFDYIYMNYEPQKGILLAWPFIYFLIVYLINLGVKKFTMQQENAILNPITIRNTNLKLNLINQHKIMFSFFALLKINQEVIPEEIIKLNDDRLENLYELYYIFSIKNVEQLLKIVNARKAFLEKELIRITNNAGRCSCNMELKHCNLIIEILYQKQKKSENYILDFVSFKNKMLFKIDF